jgi:succinyl-diaminopimelate desuccinylase
MRDPVVQKIQDWLRAHEEDLLRDTRLLLQIPSIEGPALPNAPFGQANRDALDLALKLSKEAGMATTDLDGFLGFAEFGKGERLVLSLGHLDVVPTGPGWKHEPFEAEVDGGYIYARGSTDDKGPTMASFYAMKAMKECVPNLPARMRQAFGCNEESGFKCVYRYMETEEAPTFGVAPDSGWPLYHAEKGIADLEISAPLPGGDFALIGAMGGQRPNIVIDDFNASVKVAPSIRAEIDSKLPDSWDKNLDFHFDGDVLHIHAIGKAAHGSTPFRGDSAAIRVFRFLRELAPTAQQPFYDELFDSTHVGGAGIGIAGSDKESKDLTCNLGIVKSDAEQIHLLFNIRYPVTWQGTELQERCRTFLGKLESPFELKVMRDSKPLYFPLDHPLVKTIVDVYTEETGEVRTPGTMGGGTYARAVPNTVSIGTGWWGDGRAHETDERLKVEHLFKMSRIYAHILYRLATL